MKKIATTTKSRSVNVLNDSTDFEISESYKRVRLNLMFSIPKVKCKKILFTSCNPADGKTTTAVNMAISIAQTGAKVMLLDCDLRKPRANYLLKKNNKIGLSNVICGLNNLDDAICTTKAENVDLISAGFVPPNPAELLNLPEFEDILHSLEEKYDYIIIDTPPVNMISDALIIANKTNGIVLVVKENQTRHEEVSKALKAIELSNAKMLGFILTATKTQKSKGYYKYGYGYGYSHSHASSQGKTTAQRAQAATNGTRSSRQK